MANPFSVDVPDVGGALQALMQGYQFSSGIGREYARKQALAGSGGNVENALARLIQMGDIDGAAKIGSILQAQQGMQGVYGNVIYGQDDKGNTVIGTHNKRGGFVPIQTPGFTPTLPTKTVDTGTGTAIIPGRQTFGPGGAAAPAGVQTAPGQPNVIQKDVGGAARERKLGEEQGEKLASMGQAKAALDNATAQLDRLQDSAFKIQNNPALGRVTGVQGMFPNWPGGKAADVQGDIDTLGSQVAYAVLQNMRDMSKTGGAVGQVSNYETQLLQNNLAAVSRLQSQGKYKEAMQLLIDYSQSAKKRLKEAYDADYGSLKQPAKSQPQAAPQQAAPRAQGPNGEIVELRNGQWVPVQ